ncbi:hypothetical protein ACFL12_08140 [Pseudomonadota bacterium]
MRVFAFNILRTLIYSNASKHGVKSGQPPGNETNHFKREIALKFLVSMRFLQRSYSNAQAAARTDFKKSPAMTRLYDAQLLRELKREVKKTRLSTCHP